MTTAEAKIEMVNRHRALRIIENIFNCQGYAETGGDQWLGPRLMQLRDFIEALPRPAKCYCSSLPQGYCDFCTGIRK